MPLRVIAGKAKGRRLKLVPGGSTRPIMDRVKESLFNIIGPAIIGTNFLDLFSGTGSVGIEALSRGAEHALLVDMNRNAIKTIRENLRITGLEGQAVVRQANAFVLLKKAPARVYDYIYVAPPQYVDLWWKTLEALHANPAWIPEGTQVIVQIDPKEMRDITEAFPLLQEVDRRKYGRTLLLFTESVAQPKDNAQDTNGSTTA